MTTAQKKIHVKTFEISFLVFLCLAPRYVNPKYSEYYEGTGFSKVLIDKNLNTLVIRMNLNTRSENGLLLYIAAEVNHFSYVARNTPV